MPRFDSLITTTDAPVTPADVAAAEAAAIAACAPNTVVAGNSLFHAFLSSDQAIGAGGLTETILCDQVVVDDGANYNPIHGEWKCPTTGSYRVQGRIGGGATGDQFVGQIFVDAGPSILTDASTAAANALPGAHLDTVLDLIEGQAVTLRVTETKAGTPGFNVAGALSLENTHFTIYRVR